MMPMPSDKDLRVPLLCSGGKTPSLGSTFGNFARLSSHRNREEEPVKTCPRPKKTLDWYRAKKERHFRASEERHPKASLVFVSFLCAFPKLFPSLSTSTQEPPWAFSRFAAVLVRRDTEPYYALDRSVRGAALVKLVHRSIEQARPADSSWPLLPAASIVLNTNPSAPRSGLRLNLPLPGACSTTRWFTSAIEHKEKYLILRLETALRPSA
jgi:hypothetical protein